MRIVILGHDVGVLAKRTFREVLADNILGLAAEAAYAFFFGIFPLLLFAAPMLSLIGNREELFNTVIDRLGRQIPPAALALVAGVIRNIVFTKNAPGIISVGALLSLWSGAGMFGSLMGTLNVAYDVQDKRPWWKQKVIAVACTLCAIVMLLGSTAILIGGQQIADAASQRLGLGPAGTVMWAVLQYLLAIVLVVAFIWMLYIILPDLHQGAGTTLPGAILAAVLWVLFTYLFRLYVTNFGAYNKAYGTVGAVMILLTWMYWTTFVILVGGEFNSELHAGTGAVSGRDRVLRAQRVATREGVPHPSAQPRQGLSR